MPTFIDESGETGRLSPHFRLAAVWFPTPEEVEAFRAGIQSYQKEAGLEGYEFKWSKGGASRRPDYFHEAVKHPFRFVVATVDKQHPEWRAAGGSVVHWASVVSLAAALRPVYLAEEAGRAGKTGESRPLNEPVIVDDNEDADFLALVKQKFRGLRSGIQPNSPLVKKVRFRGSGPDELIQLADMICGATGAYLDGDETWYKIFAARDLGIVHIP